MWLSRFIYIGPTPLGALCTKALDVPVRLGVGLRVPPNNSGKRIPMPQVPTLRLSQHAMETAVHGQERIKALVRVKSPTLTTACRQAGMSLELAEVCGGLLASVVEDLVQISALRKTDFERTKRKQRILSCTSEPAASALRIAMAASPINGQTVLAHWDAICEKHELGQLAWMLGADTVTAYGYSRRMERRA